MNGACDRARFAIWILPANMDGLRRALEISGYGPDLCAGSGLEEVSLADDSRSVTSVRVSQDTDNLTPEQLAQYQSGDTIRIRERFCLDDATDTYLRCSMQLSLDRY
jgi:hypothetical protein